MCHEPIIGAMDMPNDPRFPPDSPLPGAPDPWAASSAPPVRSGPPYLMDEMIAAEPALAERLFWLLGRADGAASRLAAEVKAAAAAGAPIVATGCGTSEHGAMAIAAILTDALRTAGRPASVTAAQAFEAALDPQDGGLLIGVSHEGGTAATLRAMDAARARGARVGLITVSERAPGAAHADVVVATGEQDQSWCHTVGYLSPVLAGAALGGLVSGIPPEVGVVRDLLFEGANRPDAAESLAAALAGADRLLVVGSGVDLVSARELALKIEEACYLPASAHDIETVLHGHLPATDARTGMIIIVADPLRRNERWERGPRAVPGRRADRDPQRCHPRGRDVVGAPAGADPRGSDPRAGGTGSPGPGRGARRDGDAAPGPREPPGTGARREPGPHPLRRHDLPRGVATRRVAVRARDRGGAAVGAGDAGRRGRDGRHGISAGLQADCVTSTLSVAGSVRSRTTIGPTTGT